MTNLAPFDGELYLIRQFYPYQEAQLLFVELLSSLAWQEESIFIFGKWVKVPRLMCWIGDADVHYRYSGVDHQPSPWTQGLQAVRQRIEQQCRYGFNSVLANLYRDGQDSMGCHADNEKELGVNPLIASLSFGEVRLFRMHHKKRKERLDIFLQNGDLLIMAGALQHHWLHSLPKTKQPKTPRINLTFRKIQID
ncbi:MAG: alpha-ketoglutarate-dependent dioxygenase AlkB [Methylococcaceae bacterium]|jgi:alkylated DNA repair dioxygenase AlkB|nr:alpha-ketoglutarate-dependent dioxygenase AlkB [Methylococcaceae bacterium]MDZ4155319.1 alpha-ketoglutarate-dependent dioxygenase AlkB [Methylococcales bacterium]MDP2393931.1 alpha-ketoglutarate-dependent dioxygenase AlkB [Methylococcaceae bacterium]MDP3018081.1 alpha-ketoglutarate-dependent dioxygenase AlkB [Methylococcaceae bacterium]MDP3391808.1 alpha-ketoglutarate-dependent dioxygenase AlkB [Methylococcaceae bacterium]